MLVIRVTTVDIRGEKCRLGFGRGEITEARLIERGLMAPAQNRGPKPVNGLAKALEG